MYILGIQKNHNSSVALFKDYELIYYNQEERLSRIKQDSLFPIKCLEQIKKFNIKIDKVILTGYDTTNDFELFGVLEKLKIIESYKNCFHFYKTHHLIHAAKALYSSGFNDALIFVFDGRGSSFILENGYKAFETLSVYQAKQPFNFNCVYKKLLTYPEGENKKVLYENELIPVLLKNKPVSLNEKTIFEVTSQDLLCPLYSRVTKKIGYEVGEEGKTMGLKAYGNSDSIIEETLLSKDLFTEDNCYNLELGLNKKYFKGNEDNKKIAFETQKIFEKTFNDILQKFKHLNKNIILTGGGALNILNNYQVLKKIKNTHNLYVEPMCGDEGNSIGAALLYIQLVKPKNKLHFNNIYLGPKPVYKIKKSTDKINTVIRHLLKNKIIALFQGAAEAGPRALGNRSLLFDPRIKNGKDIINKVKKREWFRPFGCSVLEEEADNWFDMQGLKNSPFMMYGVECLPNKKEIIPSIVHADNSCRIQTVNEKENKVLYNILKQFFKKTGVPILLNTSLNLAGFPLVETPEEALEMFNQSDIDVLYFSDINKVILK